MLLQHRLFSAVLILSLLHLLPDSECSRQGDLIGRWAEQLGKDLWDLSRIITKRHDIQNSYKGVDLETKDPKQIINEIVGNVSYMMTKKMEAVNCIIEAAEQAALQFELNDTDHNFTYYRSNPPKLDDKDEDDDEDPDPDIDMYLPMQLDNDTHFFNLRVNTTHSAVHVPSNVYHKHKEPESVIRWSEVLDETFKQNYKADPAITWQYFGSSSGVMRHYPAMEWDINDKDLFDCRIRTWYIEAATCTKDIIILLDNSGSMTGMNKHIASLIVNTVLETLSNNDYINVMNYSETTDYLVSCFKDILVQATEENIEVLKNALIYLDPQEKSFINLALIKAFELLNKTNLNPDLQYPFASLNLDPHQTRIMNSAKVHLPDLNWEYRELRGCFEDNRYCNQAIMLISDGIPTNVSDIINKYNRIHNGSSIPIRIFTFLVGKEASHLSESVWIACSNRGYHSHVDSLEQVSSSVFKYVQVLARPLVLEKDHPLSWTHAYIDDTFELGNKSSRKFEKFRLLTSVAGPAFDLRANEDNTTKTAQLLGVAGTDVPLDDIAKLMYPYKTGVNSHSFIISNNGYVVKHPGLRPLYVSESHEELKINYNSIDLTEVEQLDDDEGARVIGPELEELRTALVLADKLGVKHDVKIKYHYDDMRRVSREVNDYYYAPINGTPFTIAFAIPDLYGNYSIEVNDEIDAHRYTNTHISSFFTGSNWKIHPKWVYCTYHYLEGHEFDTPESELVHFINKMNNDDFQWSMQYEKEQEHKAVCGAKTLEDDDYYCDRYLVQRLMFDAKKTKPAFKDPWIHRNKAENTLRLLYNATLRFIATMSGLTRWEYIVGQHNSSSTFGDLHPRAIDETWYKSAVIQHRYNNESFVYSVPFDVKDGEDILVTGSYAIFHREENIEAPGAVVGYQFSHAHLKKQFFHIASAKYTCHECLLCGTDHLECYIIDSSGYIIISSETTDTGKFFGEIDGAVMEAMIRQEIFEKITIRDYQAECYYDQWIQGSGNILTTPFHYFHVVIQWVFSQILWIAIKINLHTLWNPDWVLIKALDSATTPPLPKVLKKCVKCNEQEERWHQKNKIPQYEERHTACEKERDLYILRQEIFYNKNLYPAEVPAHPCVRPFYIKMIKHSNLFLIAIDARKRNEKRCFYTHTTALRDIVYEHEIFPCQKLNLNNLTRRRLKGCYNEHEQEKEILDCGKCGKIHFCTNLLTVTAILSALQTFQFLNL